jgi:hypothetical protein
VLTFPSVLAMVSVVPGKMLMVTVELLLAAAESTLGATGPMVALLGKVESTAVTLVRAVMVTVQVAPIGAAV